MPTCDELRQKRADLLKVIAAVQADIDTQEGRSQAGMVGAGAGLSATIASSAVSEVIRTSLPDSQKLQKAPKNSIEQILGRVIGIAGIATTLWSAYKAYDGHKQANGLKEAVARMKMEIVAIDDEIKKLNCE
jgi:hypothetical protein